MTTSVPATLVQFAAAGTVRRRLVCLPFAGGSASTYRLWPRFLPDDVEVQFVQLPGRAPRDPSPPLDSVGAMVDSVLLALDAVADLPYSMFGHSMGALVAFELTAALERRGTHAPHHLFVSARRAPDDSEILEPTHGLDDRSFVDVMQRRYGAIPDAVASEPELLALLLPPLRADVKAYETYQPLSDTLIDTPLHVFGGRSDRRPRPEDLHGWQRVASRPITLETFDGGHFYLDDSREALTSSIATRWRGVRA